MHLAARRGLLRALAVALMLGAVLLVFVLVSRPAQAAFPGVNGWIAFQSDRDGARDWEIYLHHTEGGTGINVTNNEQSDFEPSFSPDGKKVAFFGNGVVWVANIDGSGIPINVSKNITGASDPAFSPNGNRIVFGSFQTGNGELYMANANGSGTPTNVTNTPTVTETLPAFSPDGTKIAFMSKTAVGGDSNVWEITVANADGSGTPTNITNNSAYDAHPNFSPDGKKIAFHSTRSGNQEDVYVVNADGSGIPTNITNTPTVDEAYPSFSPDGTKMAYMSAASGTDWEITVANADGSGAPTNITNNSANDMSPDWGRYPNDNFVFNQAIRGNDASVPGMTTGATRETGEPDHYTSNPADANLWVGDHSVWYVWTAPSSGPVTIDTCQTNIDSILAIYTGSSLNTLSRVADNNNDFCGGGWGSKVSFNAVAGRDYRIAVGDAGGLRENIFTLKLSRPPPPANDNLANAQTISGASATLNGTNVGATRESGEPNHLPSGGSLGENTVWYNWTAPSSGQVNMDTCTSSFDTTLAVYTGSALSTLSQAGSDDDSCDTPNDFGSRLSFNATAGTTYRIAVGGFFSHSVGTFTFKLAPADTTPPKVMSTSPANGAPQIAPGVNVTATFTEAMDAKTLVTTPTDPANPNVGTSTTFKLFRAGTTTAIEAVASYNATANKATLNPNANLRLGTKYKAVVTTGAQDVAGNRLDQNSSLSGLQQKAWTFTIRN